MKTFTYTIRDKDGRLKKGAVQAADRAGAMREVKALGGVPLSVSEARPGVDGAAPQGVRRALLWALAVVPVVLAALWFWCPWAKDAKPVSATPSVSSVPLVSPVTRIGVQAQAASGEGTEGTEETQELGSAEGQIAEAAAPPAPRRPGIRRLGRDGKPIETGEDTAPPPPDTTFRTRTEHLLSAILSAPPGAPVPPIPIPPGMERDFAAALTNVITVHGDDTDEMAARKERVAWLKQDLAAMVADGADPADALRDVERYRNEVAAYRRELLRRHTQLRREGLDGEAGSFLDEANEELRQHGDPPLTPLPEQLIRRMNKE